MAQGHKTLATVFHAESEMYTKVVAGYTVPVKAMFREGDTLTALQARALSAYFLERGASVANSNIDRGSWKDKSDVEKIELASKYLGGEYKFSDDIGGEVFGASLLHQAAERVLAAIPANAEKLKGLTPADVRTALRKGCVALLNSPQAVENYETPIRDAIAAILAERHEKRERKAKSDSVVEIAF